MPSFTSASILALAASSALALTPTSAKSDLDGSVWKALENAHPVRNIGPQLRNRPTKRQSGWNPPSDLVAPLKEVWQHYEKTYDGSVFNNKNWGWDQVMANNGSLNICVRWDSTATVTAAQRTKIASAYKAQYQKWFKWLYGFDGFPYSNVDVNIVAWATKDASLLQGSTDGLDVYTTYKDGDGVPACATECERAAHLDGNFSGCKSGRHFDHSLWLTDGLQGGFGYDWGQQIGREYMINNLDSENIHILLHEMGHTFGLDDYVDWTPTGESKFIMLAGASMEITDFDGWMYRNWWYELSKNRKWTKASVSGGSAAPAASASASATAAPSIKDEEAEEPVATPTAAPVATSAPAVEEPVATPPAVEEPVASVPAVEESGATPPASGNAGSGATAGRWAQCGGNGYTGPTACASGSTCTKQNEWYSQCL
ncbi:cellulose-binding family II [Colletotrichum truncatum]|uniref:Cellulose-binding family II n=1 Tax=Colletotrichum truncatum TaxID=5467 RepID=A0ACC3YXY8_COLTU|nr:cellulose-binding family II [Colletotrichum truncatum]KAF6790864.1 cellulose-binding family II [Colletotrichum truncatum]